MRFQIDGLRMESEFYVSEENRENCIAHSPDVEI